ncbi:TetR/AcrR family transcriptional regulator [Lentzea guizhouensis]|uniref:TetR/AcrR family transcriptional regulator n=1 Tax=Lentzea guizhouensis TaxID=1586287 RepID=UPI000AAAEA88|nr:TetR family transcriptional regulator [Lentzea guizhouensis]
MTVTQIAERAGITRRTYFRYFPDKREVLFAGAEQLPVAIAEAVRTSREETAPAIALDAVRRVGALLVERSAGAAQRRAVIAFSPELLERERTKRAALMAALGEALRERGVEAGEALLVARLVAVCFEGTIERWIARAKTSGPASIRLWRRCGRRSPYSRIR